MRFVRWPRGAPGRATGTALALAFLSCASCLALAGAERLRTGARGAGPPVIGLVASPAAPAGPGGGAPLEPRAVLQLGYGGGLGGVPLGPPSGPDLITHLTLWDDGRVVFRASRGAYREAQLSAATVAAVLAAAADLYALGDFYAGSGATDAASSGLAVDGARGRKAVEAYAADPYAARPGEGSHAELERLRAVWRAAVAALPPDAPAMAPDDVVVSLSPGLGRSFPGDPGCAALGLQDRWPPALVGRLTGDAAREAAGLAGVGPIAPFCVDGTVQRVSLRPVLPNLFLPARTWPAGGLPRHPAATAYDTGEPNTHLYRAPGVPPADLAAWYRTQMDVLGWRLAHESAGGRQIWVRPRRSEPAPLVELRFGAGHFEMRFVSLEGGLPRPPDGWSAPWCSPSTGRRCRPRRRSPSGCAPCRWAASRAPAPPSPTTARGAL